MIPDLNKQPLVSVLMTVYNRAPYLPLAIQSVLDSSYKNFELIIVDDCSTDQSMEIAQSYAQKDSRIRLYVNEKNLTDYPNRHRAASYAKGKYLKYLDSDDALYPFGLEIMVNRMEAFPDAALGLSKWSLGDRPFPVYLSPREAYQWSFLNNRYLFTNAPSSAIILKEAYDAVGGFTGLNQVGDCEFWMILAAKYPVVLIEGGTNWARDHQDSEKYKDSALKKAEMIFNLNKSALESPNNPLSDSEREKAISLLIHAHKTWKRKYKIRLVIKKLKFFS